MQNLTILQSQIESLKEMIEVMEMTNPDYLAKKWRSKVYEELVRSKQSQIMHSLEIKKFKEEEKRLRAREQQIKTALESAHLQASSLNLERVKLQKEIQTLQLKSRGNTISTSLVLSLQSLLSFNLELHTKTLSMLDTFNHRIAFSMSKIKTAKILHTREVLGLRSRVSEEAAEDKRRKEEAAKVETLMQENQKLIKEKMKLEKELESCGEEFKRAESNANFVLVQSNEQFQKYVSQLESQLDEKVNENYLLQNKYEKIEKETKERLEREREMEQKVCELLKVNEEYRSKVAEITQEKEKVIRRCEEKQLEIEKFKESVESLKESLSKSEASQVQEQEKTLESLESKQKEIMDLRLSFERAQKENEDIIEDKLKESDFLRSKVLKLEGLNKDLRRDRDILFENCKKSSHQSTENKEIQTETQLKQSVMKKTIPPQSRLKDLEALGKEIFDL